MSEGDVTDISTQFRELLAQCRHLYVGSGELAARQQAPLLDRPAAQFVELMDDLHRALAVKVFVTICEADRGWSRNEILLAQELIDHLWNQRLADDQLRAAIGAMLERSAALKWYALVRPFDEIAVLRDHVGELEALVVRMANLVARVDGPIKSVEAARVRSIQDELHVHLRPIPIDEPGQHVAADQAGTQAIDKIYRTADQLPATRRSVDQSASAALQSTPRESLAEVMAELDRLIGLDEVKQEVRTLVNFLKVQAKRAEAGLPAAAVSLHMVFGGNPGTGKTTVARIIGRLFGAMGVLQRGHLVETDRSGLVAEYAGQTGPKTHKKIDAALDGVLFIDEAYTLIHADGDDPYGHEAVQTLLKRMEDNRDRLVVVLAGYPDDMARLLGSNPGLQSRFSRHLAFADYAPLDLARIFGQMCQKSHYHLCPATRAKTMLGLSRLYQQRDRRFGNGRAVRNLFEHVIRRHANRVAAVSDLSIDQLATLDPEDVEFKDCSGFVGPVVADGPLRFRIACPHCRHVKAAPAEFLGRTVRCPKCRREFVSEWGEIDCLASDPQR